MIQRGVRHLILAALILACTSAAALGAMDAETEQLARWQLNNADLLVDEGKYMQAVEYIDSAYEISRYPKTRSDALLAKAMVLATFLDAPEEAIAVYGALAREFPAYGEIADYQSAFLLLQSGKAEDAKKGFTDYLRKYPNGRFRFQAEAMLESMGVPGEAPENPEVVAGRPVLRVLLSKKSQTVTLRATGGEGVCIDGGACRPALVVKPAGSYCSVDGSVVRQPSITMRSAGPIAVSMDGKAKTVRGELSLQVVSGKLSVLNRVNIEDYLRSVVPAESYASWPVETLKAQAVAARTYAYYQKLHRTGRDYDVRADTYDQMYGGVERETKRTDGAVQATAGMVLNHGGKPILSQYTANSGGHTADAGAVFGTPKPYLVAHADPASLEGKMASWKRSYSTGEIVQALRKIGVEATGLTAIEPAVTGPSGRLVKVRLRHAKGSTVVRTRTTLASSRVLNLPEVLMDVEKQGDRYVFRGHGHGHGVGYSQWGAAELGGRMDHQRILEFYYPHTVIEKMWK